MASLPPPPNGYSACRAVIGDAINRCRYVDTLSRVTIAVKHLENNPASLLSLFQVSISDTGRGISCEEVSMLYECFSSAYPTHFCAPLFWEGELLIITTEFMEEEVRQYQINDAFYKPRIMQLRSLPKESGRYCGTNITLHLKGYPEKLLLYIHDICRKMEILMLKNVVVEVCNARLPMEGSIHEDVLLLSEGLSLPPELSNLERLSVGLANHVLNCLDEENGLPSVSKRTSLKIGKALAGSSETATERIWFFEVCFVVTEAPNIDDTSTSMRQVETKVLFFQDFLCASITPTIVQSLKTKVNWENFGLRIKSIRLDDFGMAIIEWENLSRFDSIGLVLHRYRSNQTRTIPWSREANLLKKSVEESLNDMKQKFPHLFLSHRSIELQKYAPDVSSCISRMISSSSDVSFKASCAEILGVESTDFSVVELQIRTKVLQIIENIDKLSAQDAFQKSQKKISSKYFLRCEEQDESEILEEDEDEGSEYDSSEGTSIWEYL